MSRLQEPKLCNASTLLPMDRVSSVLRSVLHRRGLHVHAAAAQVTHEAREWLLKQRGCLRDSVSVKSLKDGVLLLECAHPVALQEMQGASEALLAHLKKDTQTMVKQIRVTRR